MQLQSFPGCCTAQVLVGFGQSDTAAYGYRPARPYTEETFYEEAKRLIQNAGRMNQATIIAITNNDQTVAMTVLPRLGFKLVQEKIGKNQHADKTLNTYVYTVNDADRVPLEVPANPFVAPVPARANPAPQRLRGQAPIVSQDEIDAYRECRFVAGTRLEINDRLLANRPRRNAQGQFLPVIRRGLWYTVEEANRFEGIPHETRYCTARPGAELISGEKVYRGGALNAHAGYYVLFA